MRSRQLLLVISLAIFGVAIGSAAQQKPPASTESQGTPAAKALFAQGEKARDTSADYAGAAAFFRKAIDADPFYVEAHNQFMFATRQAAQTEARKAGTPSADATEKADASLRTLYAGWAARDPKNAVYAWALGELNSNNWDEAEKHYLRAVSLDPSFARAYQQLSLVADFRGDSKKRIDYSKKASDLAPADPAYFFYYASAMKAVDVPKSIELLQETATRFPQTERGAQGLYWAAFETADPAKKIAIYERLKNEFPPAKFGWSSSGMEQLFEAYTRHAPAKALALANELVAALPTTSAKKTWNEYAAFQLAMVDGQALIAKGQYAEAVAAIDKVTRPKHIDTTLLDELKARALDASGDTKKAYESLAAVAAASPTDSLYAALGGYAKKLGKDQATIDADLWALRAAKATPAFAFSLPRYPELKPLSLADYKGQVVLVNFWYPTCGPCRGEFPTLQRVLTKYKDRGFTILAINVYPDEDSFVMPYLRNSGFTFTPLKSDTKWAETNYGARGYPTNVLVDADGRIIFRPGVIRSVDEQRRFELQVEALLKRAGK
jgi:thiol-disulfide isomerase/thioredoxin/predicted Zn-dependent protease